MLKLTSFLFTTGVISLLLGVSPAYSSEKLPSWEKIERSPKFQELSYKERLNVRKGYFDDYFVLHSEFTALIIPEKLEICTNWLSEELNDKNFTDWKKRNNKLQAKYLKKKNKVKKKRDKCITKAAEKAGSDRGLKILTGNCIKKYPYPKEKRYSKDNYTAPSEDIAAITGYCKSNFSPKLTKVATFTPEQLEALITSSSDNVRDNLNSERIKFRDIVMFKCLAKQPGNTQHCLCIGTVAAQYVDMTTYNQTSEIQMRTGYYQDLRSRCSN